MLIAARQAEKQTNKSLNTLPEYFINIKIADAIFNRFPKSYKYSLEDSLASILDELGIEKDTLDSIDPEFRLTGDARTDLVLRSKSGKVRHLVEIKRNLSTTKIKKDALRLAATCLYAPFEHRIEKNFLLAISTCNQNTFAKRTKSILEWLDEYDLNDISVQYQPVDLNSHISYKAGRPSPKTVHGGIWQFEYKH